MTSDANVTCGSPRRSASIAGTTLIEPSVDAMPQSTRSALCCSIALASTSEVAIASEPWIASSLMCTPSSAPICKDLRMAARASSGPIVTTTTWLSSASPASRIFSASSTAYSSSSDSTPSTPTRSTVLSELNVRSAVASGTYLTQTTIFMAGQALLDSVVQSLTRCERAADATSK